MYQGKSNIIAKRNVLVLFRNKQKYNYSNYIYVSYAHEVDVKIE